MLLSAVFAVAVLAVGLFGQFKMGPGNGLTIYCDNPTQFSLLYIQNIGIGGQVSARCIPIDGSSVFLNGGHLSSYAAVFVDAETPAGTIDGSNASFVLAFPPSPASSLLLTRNGIVQKQNVDFIVHQGTVIFQAASVPGQGDLIQAWYRH